MLRWSLGELLIDAETSGLRYCPAQGLGLTFKLEECVYRPALVNGRRPPYLSLYTQSKHLALKSNILPTS